MKQTVLKKPLAAMQTSLRKKMAICLLAAFLTLALNLVLVLTAQEKTNTLFCVLNIASDFLCGVFIIWFYDMKIAPERVLYRIASKPMTDFFGEITELAGQTVRYMDMDCIALTVDERKLFVPSGTIKLQVNEAYRFRLASNIIMEAEQ